MPREAISGIQDCAKALSVKRGCSIAVAHGMMTDMLEVIVDEIQRLGGVQFVNLFTIKKYLKYERKGLFEMLNPQYGVPTVEYPLPSLSMCKFKPRLNMLDANMATGYVEEPQRKKVFKAKKATEATYDEF